MKCLTKAHAFRTLHLMLVVSTLFSIFTVSSALAQPVSAPEGMGAPTPGQNIPAVELIKVKPDSSDQAIDTRLTSILEATGWFSAIAVEVKEGVVFLEGQTDSPDYRIWAGNLAGKISDVVAVVNRIQVTEGSPWDFSPAVIELEALLKLSVQRIPRLVVGLLVFFLTGITAWLVGMGTKRIFIRRLNLLLGEVAARVSGIFVLLLGLYLVLQVVGLSRLAATVLGGTGLIGLVAGIAFRDILENYLSSILISLHNPFRLGDLVEVAGHTGLVQRVTTRVTVLMNLDGNHVQIPNTTIYKSIIRNFTANPMRREIFEVGIGFENRISLAQDLVKEVLNGHTAVLGEPEALVLVDRLGSATVNLKVFFWYDGSVYNGAKVKSSLIRLVKRTYEAHGVSMPDEAREVLFPDGVSVRVLEALPAERSEGLQKPLAQKTLDAETISSGTEGNLVSEDVELQEQARKSRVPEEGQNLLAENPQGP